MSEGEVDVEESIKIILTTAKGERMMRFDFGCGINEFIFDVVDVASVSRIEQEIAKAIKDWEPRVDLLKVKVDRDDVERENLLIDIDYVIKETNQVKNLVYPFYLV